MARDSLFLERIVWEGRPVAHTVPFGYRIGALTFAMIACVATAFAVVTASMSQRPGGLILFAAWSATIAVGARYFPAIWRSELHFIVTDKHVMWKRGRLRRTISRADVSYARIHWHAGTPGVGDLELVRAVPTGALRRRLALVLPGVVGPDRLWAIIRGVPAAGGAGDGDRPLAQRLDDGERVLWAARPVSSWRGLFPTGWRELLMGITAALVASALGRQIVVAVPVLARVSRAGLAVRSAPFLGLAVGVFLTATLLAGLTAWLAYSAFILPARLQRRTRYLITDRRVLIQRGREELYLDRGRIVDVIETPSQHGLSNLFLVLDGPKARALAAGGAFGERDIDGLQPVLHAVSDAEEVSQILQMSAPKSPLTDAA